MLALLLAGLMLVLWRAPDTPAGRWLNRMLVETPNRWLARISRGQVLLWIVALGLVCGIIWLLGDDGRMMVAMGLPDVMGLSAALDLSALLDLAAVAVIAAGTIRVRAIAGWVKARFTPRARHVRARRSRRSVRPPANDDERRGFAIAA